MNEYQLWLIKDINYWTQNYELAESKEFKDTALEVVESLLASLVAYRKYDAGEEVGSEDEFEIDSVLLEHNKNISC